MLAIKGFVEHRSIQGLMYAVYVFTAGDGNKPVSSGVSGGMMGSARDAVNVLVGASVAWSKSERWSETSLKTLDLKCRFVTGVVAKLIYKKMKQREEAPVSRL